MKFKILIIGLILSHLNILAQDIATARQQDLNSVVTVEGIVTNGEELGPIRYIQDQTAGIAIYDPEVMADVVRGDSIIVSGILVDYNGLLEIQPVNSLIVQSGGQNVIPQSITPNQIGEETESELISIDNVIFENAGQSFSVGTHAFSSQGQTGIIYVKSGSELENEIIPTCPVSIIAISSQYSFTGFDGYQLLIRDMNDIIFPPGICFSSGLSQSNLTTSSFDINWTTNSMAFSNLNYGLTTDLELGTLYDEDNNVSLDHTVSLENLEAGTIYYIQAYSYINGDTVYSAIQPFATVSNSSGQIRVCFNNSVDTSVATIQNAQYSGVYTNDTIKAYIDKAQYTLDIAIYNHSDNLITTAINDAYDRGVRIRYITCGSTATLALGSLNSNIPVLERPDLSNGIMHNKFVIIDANIFDSCWVLNGSTNWTSAQLFDDPNNLVMVQDQSVARTFELEFEEMWGSDGDFPNAANSKFGAQKSNNTPHHFLVNGNPFEVYFSPSDNTTSKIIEAIESANDEIDFGLLVFTKNELAWAIEDRFNDGVQVNGIIEQINSQGSEYEYLLDLGVNVWSHQGVSNDFHHKYCIIDHANTASDPLVVTGSHNWSTAAETTNDENTIIVHNANIANQFYQEFHQRMNELENVAEPSFNCIDQACVDPLDGSGTYISLAACEFACNPVNIEDVNFQKINLFPNPNSGTFQLELTSSHSKLTKYQILDIQGKTIAEEELNTTSGYQQFSIEHPLNSGFYFFVIDNQRIKFVVQ